MKGADSALSKTWIMAPTNDTMHGLHLLSHLQQPTPLLSHSHPLLAAPPVSSPNCGSELSSASGRDWGLLELNTLLPPVQPLFPATMHQTCCHQPLFAPALPCRLACLRAANSCRGSFTVMFKMNKVHCPLRVACKHGDIARLGNGRCANPTSKTPHPTPHPQEHTFTRPSPSHKAQSPSQPHLWPPAQKTQFAATQRKGSAF